MNPRANQWHWPCQAWRGIFNPPLIGSIGVAEMWRMVECHTDCPMRIYSNAASCSDFLNRTARLSLKHGITPLMRHE